MNELQLSKDLNVITAEIQSYKQIAGQSIFEIGRRLKHVKENDLVHGEWEKWCSETVEITPAYANRYIKVFDEFKDSNQYTSIGLNKLYQIATLPEEEREKEHTLDNGETKTVDEMTVRELQELKRKLKEEKEAKEQAEERAEQARQSEEIALKKLEEEQAKEPKVIEKEVIKKVEVVPDDIRQKLEQYEKELEVHQESLAELETLQERLGDVQVYEKEIRALNKKKNMLHEEHAELMARYREMKESEDVATQRARLMNAINMPLSKLRERKGEWEELLKEDIELDSLTINRIRLHADLLDEMKNILLMYISPYVDGIEVINNSDYIDVEGVVVE